MFRKALLEELAMMMGEEITEHYGSMNNTAESVYINYGSVRVVISEDAKIDFEVPFSLTIYSQRGDFAFGWISEKYALYSPDANEIRITPDDEIERPSWSGDQVLSITKDFVFTYSEGWNRQTKKIKSVEIK